MKNIHVIPTDKPSRLHKFGDCFDTNAHLQKWHNDARPEYYNIYITNDEEIKDGDCILNLNTNNIVVNWSGHGSMEHWVKIILTDNKDLIDDGVQAIDDEFLEWFIKNSSCEYVDIEIKPMFPMYSTFIESIDNPPFYGNLKRKIIIPKEEPKHPKVFSENENELFFDKEGNLIKEEPKQETLEEVVEKLIKLSRQDAFYEAVKWQAKRSYSEEEVKTIINDIVEKHCTYFEQKLKDDVKLEWFEQFKKK